MLWLDQLSIDILVPCGFYRDLLFYGPNSVMVAAFEAIAGTLPLEPSAFKCTRSRRA
jgi:hypothetical protein